nr:unnamed protein product [Naegleria fowleri]
MPPQLAFLHKSQPQQQPSTTTTTSSSITTTTTTTTPDLNSSSSLLPFPAHINPKQFKPLGISKLNSHHGKTSCMMNQRNNAIPTTSNSAMIATTTRPNASIRTFSEKNTPPNMTKRRRSFNSGISSTLTSLPFHHHQHSLCDHHQHSSSTQGTFLTSGIITSGLQFSSTTSSVLRAVASSLSINSSSSVVMNKRAKPMHYLTRSFHVKCNLHSSMSSQNSAASSPEFEDLHVDVSSLFNVQGHSNSRMVRHHDDDADDHEMNPNKCCSSSQVPNRKQQQPQQSPSSSDHPFDMQISSSNSDNDGEETFSSCHENLNHSKDHPDLSTSSTLHYETLVNKALRPLHEYEIVITSIARRRILIEYVNSELSREAETFQREFLIRAQVDAE